MKSKLTELDNAILLAEFDSKEISVRWQSELGIEIGPKFKELGTIQYWECPKTNFRWFAPNEAEGTGKLYEELEKKDWYYMSDKWEFEVAINILKGCNSILEIGSGEGYFLQKAEEYGLNIVGTELNPKAAARSRSKGYKIFEKSLDALKNETSIKYDAICSFQVLEHVANPLEFLKEQLNLLNPGGRIICAVPNANVLKIIDPKNTNLLNIPPHHMGHWDEGVFRSLESIIPIKVKSVYKEPIAKYHIIWMLTGYLRNILSPLGKTITRSLINRYTIFPLYLLMLAGLRKFFSGHTILVELEYCPNKLK